MLGSGIGDPRGNLWARNWKFQKNTKLQISGIGNCKFANSDIGKSRTCEHARLKNRKLEIANLQIPKFGNLQNCEYMKLKSLKLRIANLKIQKLETAHMGHLEVWAFGIPGGEGFAPLLRRKVGVRDVPHPGLKKVKTLKCPESIQIESRTIRACSGVELVILEAIFGREIGNFKTCEIPFFVFGPWGEALSSGGSVVRF